MVCLALGEVLLQNGLSIGSEVMRTLVYLRQSVGFTEELGTLAFECEYAHSLATFTTLSVLAGLLFSRQRVFPAWESLLRGGCLWLIGLVIAYIRERVYL